MDRVATLATKTKAALDEVAEALEDADSGLEAQADTLRVIAEQQRQLAHDCLTETQPIDIARHSVTVRMMKTIEEIQDISAELLSRGKPGHSELSEAATLLQRGLDKLDH